MKVIKTSLEKIDAIKAINPSRKTGELLNVTVKITTTTTEIVKLSSSLFKIKSSFILSIVDIAQFESQLGTIIELGPDDDKLEISPDQDDTLDIPVSIKEQYENSNFYFMMAIIIPLADKMSIPLPIPPLFQPKIKPI
ncbi:hypothetical protein [Methanospirillum lacunae]|uniref:Uncharacterized protein n=1 Tax=Methanospirillum lacunae TaxID=668570 RepID=A0A2V2MX58_9EURY|nr:hypothetical protein [Methanospirillum lacunae]PWR71979.1 hypothetical protein DK846_08265 [Methanospirillum lacunae]